MIFGELFRDSLKNDDILLCLQHETSEVFKTSEVFHRHSYVSILNRTSLNCF
ncbi:Uncharacterized protein dnm_055510 [Desulfonema magnum]|uniref:Uncharacterized protein n=1 Tax=Desulfonema magnum TaxID=45655 RepID=A0A975BQ40_9BACT|nr:Uncharacterized protein dnm_055510 [Desulfonema magnum]